MSCSHIHRLVQQNHFIIAIILFFLGLARTCIRFSFRLLGSLFARNDLLYLRDDQIHQSWLRVDVLIRLLIDQLQKLRLNRHVIVLRVTEAHKVSEFPKPSLLLLFDLGQLLLELVFQSKTLDVGARNMVIPALHGLEDERIRIVLRIRRVRHGMRREPKLVRVLDRLVELLLRDHAVHDPAQQRRMRLLVV